MSTRRLFGSTMYALSVLCVILFLKPILCTENSIEPENANSTIVKTVFDSFVKCYLRSTEANRGSQCLKEKLYLVLDQTVRHNLDYVFTEEEKAELSKYTPIFKKIGRILKKNSEGPWLDTKIMHQLKLLINEDESAEGKTGVLKLNLKMYL